jgi:D-aminopeptidase
MGQRDVEALPPPAAVGHLATRPAAAPPRGRARDVLPGLHLGSWPTGPKNGITDVPGVLGHTTTIRERDGEVNTGVTVILPRAEWFSKACHAGIFRLNGAGEMTGAHWLQETGLLHSPIVITNTFGVGVCHDGINRYSIQKYGQGENGVDWFQLPVVAETFDGHLNNVGYPSVTAEHVIRALDHATADPIAEGNAGGGTGMVCHRFKGGNGTSSRVVPAEGPHAPASQSYTVAAFVQANYGYMHQLHIDGVPVGRILSKRLGARQTPEAAAQMAGLDAARARKDGSIIIILATDAPLHPLQLQRVARRAAVGLARVGGYGHNSSGDIFLAFSTAHELPVQTVGDQHKDVDPYRARALELAAVDDTTMNAIIEAAADAAEEAIYNALCMAETMTGHRGHTVEALPLDEVRDIISKYKEAERAAMG